MFERHKHGPPASSTPRRDRIFEHYFFGTPSPSEAGSGDERARSQRVTFQANSPPYHSNQQQDRPSQVKFERFQDRGKIDFVVKLPPEFEMYDLSVPDGSLDFTLGMQGYHGREFAVVMQSHQQHIPVNSVLLAVNGHWVAGPKWRFARLPALLASASLPVVLRLVKAKPQGGHEEPQDLSERIWSDKQRWSTFEQGARPPTVIEHVANNE